MVGLMMAIRQGKRVDDPGQALVEEAVRIWRDRDGHDHPGTSNPDQVETSRSGLAAESGTRRTRRALARLDDHQRAVIALHTFGGLPVDQVASALEIAPEIIYVQVADSRERLMQSAEIRGSDELSSALSAVAINAPRLAIWPLIEARVQERFEAEGVRQRRLSIGVAVAVLAVLAVGVAIVAWRGDEDEPSTTPTEVAAVAPSVSGTVFSLAPTATVTPAADVGDTIVFSSRSAQSRQSWLFEERLADLPLLGENAVEAALPVVAPDGRQVYLLWHEFDDDGVIGYLGAFDSELAGELWRVEIFTDDDAGASGLIDIKMSLAADHERVYVARQAWLRGDHVEIDVLSREDGDLLESIETTLAGFAAHDIRLHAPPGSDQINLLSITNEAPPETGGLQITFLAYEVPGGRKLHGRILFDLPDSRTFFLYESQLIAGSETLFGVEHTNFYQQIAVHTFDLGGGRLEPRLAIPFQPVANPLPYQQAVSHDGHWLYVLSSAGLEVAVFNLFDQSLAGIVPLDPGVLAGQEIGPSYPQSRAMQISPDGRRIYAEGTLAGAASGIWVIDATSWTIIDHWLPEFRPAEILLSGDGRTLYARVVSGAGGPFSGNALVAVDTASGAFETIDIPWADRFSLESISTLFRRTYASSPAVDGQRQESLSSSEPLAAAQVSVSPSDDVVGSTITVDVRFSHPLTGEAVVEGAAGARYEPPDGVRATWTLDNGDESFILELARVGYGRYQGFVQLDQSGKWSLRVDIDWPDGGPLDRSVVQQRAIRILPAVTADGEPESEQPSG